MLTIQHCGWRVESALANTASTLAVTVTYQKPDVCTSNVAPFRTILKASGVRIADVRTIALTLERAGKAEQLQVAVVG